MLACLLRSRIVDEHFIATANGKQHENMNWKFHAPFKLSLIETDYMCSMTSALILAPTAQMILGNHVFQSFLACPFSAV